MRNSELIKLLEAYPADMDVRIDNGIDIDPVPLTVVLPLPEQVWEDRLYGYGRKREFTGKTILVVGAY
jgi:hypothetical protein